MQLVRFLLALACAPPVLSAQTGAGSSHWLDFELGAPCEIAQAVAASNEYAAAGVTFVGAVPGAGPVILSDCGGAGVSASRGTGLLVASETTNSQSGPAGGPITMLFSPPADRLTFMASSAVGSGTYDVSFFAGATSVLQTAIGTGGFAHFTLSPGAPFDRVTISRRQPAESNWGIDEVSVVRDATSLGTVLCDRGEPHFVRVAASLSASGTITGGDPYTDLTFRTLGGPRNGLGLLLASPNWNFIPVPGGIPYLGNICLAAPITRLNLCHFDASGTASAVANLAALGTPLVGERWHFQLWHRFESPYFTSSSGFTNSISIDFQ